MALFSQRQGYKEVKSILQVESMDADLCNGLWNALTLFYWNKMDGYVNLRSDDNIEALLQRLWHSYFKKPIDTLGTSWIDIYTSVRSYYFEAPWNEVYDFLEFVRGHYPDRYSEVNHQFENFCNSVMERERAGYRFIDGLVTPITSEEEIVSIEEALSQHGPWKSSSVHFKRALDLLADRTEPDYPNSIKEAISGVEAACIVVSGKGGTLGAVLKKLEKEVGLHPALGGAFQKLYGYTSDAEGIRHALLEESSLTFADAKFMLVACSAFVNYLRVKVET